MIFIYTHLRVPILQSPEESERAGEARRADSASSSKSILHSLLGPIWILRDMVHRSLCAQKAWPFLMFILNRVFFKNSKWSCPSITSHTPPLGCITSWITLNPFISSSLIHLMPYVKCRDLGECFRFVVLSPNASFTYSPISHLEMFLFIFEFMEKIGIWVKAKHPHKN